VFTWICPSVCLSVRRAQEQVEVLRALVDSEVEAELGTVGTRGLTTASLQHLLQVPSIWQCPPISLSAQVSACPAGSLHVDPRACLSFCHGFCLPLILGPCVMGCL
jgi:hypothetical protein